MYSAPYGFGNGAPPGQNLQMQPGPGPGQNQPQQQVMYSSQQQYPMPPSAAFAGAPMLGAVLPGLAGPTGMVQNTALPQMANSQMGFQTPFTTSSPYGSGVSSTSGPQGHFHPNYMMAGSMAGFPMNAAGMNPQQQHMMQRIQQAQKIPAGMGTPTPPRQFPPSHGPPNPALIGQQGQFGMPTNSQATQQNQTLTQAPPSTTSVTTPQTPTFPPPTGPGVGIRGSSTPLSPGPQSRGQERVSLLLEINTELLYEAIHLRHNLEEIKKEATTSPPPEQHRERKEEEEAFQHDWIEVCRRLQANLAYLASMADRKASSQPVPAYLTSPSLNLKLKFRPMAPFPDAEKVDGSADRKERDKFLKDEYHKLQALFPGIDPNSVPIPRLQPKPGVTSATAATQGEQQRVGSVVGGASFPNIAHAPSSSSHQVMPQIATVSVPPTTLPTAPIV